MTLKSEVLAIHQWIRDDAPVSMKMTITPKLIDALVQRLDAARSEGPVSTGVEPVGYGLRNPDTGRYRNALCPTREAAEAIAARRSDNYLLLEARPLYAAHPPALPDEMARAALQAALPVLLEGKAEEKGFDGLPGPSSSAEKATQGPCPALPDGWVAVPFHCTMEMIKAGEAEYADPLPVCGPDGEDADWFSPIQAAWYAMLGARPSQKGESDER